MTSRSLLQEILSSSAWGEITDENSDLQGGMPSPRSGKNVGTHNMLLKKKKNNFFKIKAKFITLYYGVYSVCRWMYAAALLWKMRKRWMRLYNCKVLTFYMKWYNITLGRLWKVKDIYDNL